MINYIPFDLAVEKHDEIIAKSGGKHGFIDEAKLKSVLGLIENDSFYPNFVDKLTHLMFAVNKNHAFVDGNKRSSIAIAAYFLEINFYDQLTIDLFIKESENLALLVAQNFMGKDLLKKVLRDIIFDNELSESTQFGYASIALAKSAK